MKTSPKPTPQSVSNSNDQYPPNGRSNGLLAANSPSQSKTDNKSMKPRRQMRGLSLKNKATALAIALGTIPVLAIGSIAYYVANQGIINQIETVKQSRSIGLADKTNRFMFERYGDVQLLSSLRSFSDPTVSKTTSRQAKEAQLKSFSEVRGFYDSVAVFELNGDLIAKTGADIGKNSQGKITNNIKDRDHFQAVLKTNRPVISQPTVSKTTGKISLFFVAPIKDSTTGKTVAIARTRMPTERMAPVLANFSTGGDEYHLINLNNNQFFEATERNQIGRNALSDFGSGLKQLEKQGQGLRIVTDKSDNAQQLISYTPLEKLEGLPDLNWGALIAFDTEIAFAAQKQLLWTLLLGTGVATIIVSAIAAYLADKATRPILNAADAVQKMGQGELDTRIAVKGEDEIAVLGSNVNRLGEQIQTLLADQEEATRQQLATQEENVRQQSANAEQQRLGKELLQKRALELLIEVDPVSQGDLTIRANVTEDEIGTVADSYNSTISSLRKIVTQVQTAATQMATTTSSSEISVQELSAEALRQTQEITAALNQLEEMSNSIRAVATSAAQAEAAVQLSTQTVEAGDAAMNRTVEGIGAIRDTVAETSIKVKQLGASSQKISKVVKLIGTFAAQTNLLALKASIEAARAGEEGRGFAVLADEVRVLARQSAAATAEIEGLVTGIQTETNAVVAAMEAGTEQVAEGTRLVDETRQSLNQITNISNKISTLVQAIASATVTQSQASDSVTHTMTDVAAIANQTSTEANQVSASFKELLAVAQELQASANQFKVS